jgi:hypothetical protein
MGGIAMRVSFVGAALIGLALSLSPASAQQSVMKECGTQWQAAKAAGTTNGQSWPQFLKDCRARLASMGSTGGPAPAAPAAAPTAAPATGVKTASQCDAEYAANKAAIRASGQKKRDFVAACRAGTETILQGAAAAPAPAPAQQQTGSLFPLPQPTVPAPAPSPAPGSAAPTGAGQFASAQEAQGRCPGATVVWVNEHSHIYHFAGTHDYGNTKRGAYMCEADAQAAGNRAAKNERHP